MRSWLLYKSTNQLTRNSTARCVVTLFVRSDRPDSSVAIRTTPQPRPACLSKHRVSHFVATMSVLDAYDSPDPKAKFRFSTVGNVHSLGRPFVFDGEKEATTTRSCDDEKLDDKRLDDKKLDDKNLTYGLP